MMRNCGAPAVERLGLEDVAEEVDASVGEDSTRRSAPESGSCCQVSTEWEAEGPDKPGQTLSSKELEFIQLTLKKQQSYRKAIAKAGLGQLPCEPSTSSASKMDPEPYLRTVADWTESAVYGEHMWFETNVSGDYCYVGEQRCVARTLQKSVGRRKCAACKIVVHTVCIEQLEKFPSSRAILLESSLPLSDPSFRVRPQNLSVCPVLVPSGPVAVHLNPTNDL